MAQPVIIQGGMGVAVSSWRLARAVSARGQLGVVSGSLLSVVLARRLQCGDLGGHIRRVLARFPVPAVAERLLQRYFVAGGKRPDAPFKSVPMPAVRPSRAWLDLTVAASFVETALAREGHAHPVGINLLEKVQVATLATLYGAMLAGVGTVLMGAGIPRAIPGVLDRFARGEAAALKVDVQGQVREGEDVSRFDPAEWFAGPAPTLTRPAFLAIVSSSVLATTLARKSSGRVDGFVVEGHSAGGHNAPPRGPLQLDASQQPIYGPRDLPQLAAFRDLGLPFWLAGSYASPDRLAQARAAGAQGIQVGTAFAFCEESGLDPMIRQQVHDQLRSKSTRVRTDLRASPTHFPFKVLELPGTLSDDPIYEGRPRLCDLGYLRQAFAKPDGSLGYRCPAEPEADFLKKHGDPADLAQRRCLCNALLATVGLAQARSGGALEPAIVTSGEGVAEVTALLSVPGPGDSAHQGYTAAQVLDRLLAGACVAT